jgi:NAD-dependent dihydropyrimidine dehydrogenase PreA subunit
MLRKIVVIDEESCDGCGLCVEACHEKAVAVTGGKARLLRDDYCDGLGACLPVCPAGAISFEEREAAPFDSEAASRGAATHSAWPVQLRLVPAKAHFFDNAGLLLSADCAAYRHENFYRDFIKAYNVTLIACPKLDATDYSLKLSQILSNNDVKEITLVKMEVPCCGGLQWALSSALKAADGQTGADRKIPVRIVTLSVGGGVLDTETL